MQALKVGMGENKADFITIPVFSYKLSVVNNFEHCVGFKVYLVCFILVYFEANWTLKNKSFKSSVVWQRSFKSEWLWHLRPIPFMAVGCRYFFYTRPWPKVLAAFELRNKYTQCCQPQLSNLWWMPNSVRMGFGTAMRTGSSRRFKRYPTTYMWVSSWLPFTVD